MKKYKRMINHYIGLEKPFRKYFPFISIIFLTIFYIVLYKIYMPRVNAFGCFDDCNNFMGGYFLLHGKRLYSEIFFNHNPLMAYISFLVQFLSHPQNLYELILRHRQFLLLFGFIFDLVLIIRFRASAFLFVLFYELTKFYLFGDRFLAEGFIVYPLVYLVGLAWFKFQKKPISAFDHIVSGISAWFIIFMREPYVPVAIILFLYILWDRKEKFRSFLSLTIFVALSVLTIIFHNVYEFFFNVVTTNAGITFAYETNSTGILGLGFWKLFVYPISLLFGGEWGYFRYIILSLSILFISSSIIIFARKQWKLVLFSWVILGAINIRYVEPGKEFYSAFHLLPWYAVFLFLSFMMLYHIYKINKNISLVLIFFYAGILIFHIFSPLSFLHSKSDSYREFITNYGIPLQVGTVVNKLSRQTDTLFIDGFDDIIYWQSKRLSPYKYSWYTSLMPYFKKYTDARSEMFLKTPPDFYYGSCIEEKDPKRLLPVFVRDYYTRLYSDNKPSCLWVNKTKLASITDAQWKQAAENYYKLPK